MCLLFLPSVSPSILEKMTNNHCKASKTPKTKTKCILGINKECFFSFRGSIYKKYYIELFLFQCNTIQNNQTQTHLNMAKSIIR